MTEKNTINGRPVPPWVISVCYVLGWVFGVLILLEAIYGDAQNRGLLIGTGLYLIFFPIVREGPDTLYKRWLG